MLNEIQRQAQNIERVYCAASLEERKIGSQWYALARKHCRALSERYGFPCETVASVIAALSPSVSWSVNLAQAENLIDAFKRGLPKESVVVSTYGLNRDKAWAMLETGDLSILRGQKVTAFRECILNPCTRSVCIDTHAYSIASGETFTIENVPNITPKRYRMASAAYKMVAKMHNLAPYKVQAITWVAHRRTILDLDRAPVLWEK